MTVAADALDAPGGSVAFSPWTAFCAINPTIVSLGVAVVSIQLYCYRMSALWNRVRGQLLATAWNSAARHQVPISGSTQMTSGPRELDLFVRESLLRGLERESIRKAMIAAGWTTDQAQAAMDSYSDLLFPVPVPRPRPQLSAREAFLYLLLFTTLYLSSYHLGSLLFDLINRAYPDVAEQISAASYQAISMRWSVSLSDLRKEEHE
jgi:hypothetical protein